MILLIIDSVPTFVYLLYLGEL